jgi:hypothetical protein
VDITSGKLYLIEERVPLRTHQLLRKELARGRASLYISKHSPGQLVAQFSLDSDRGLQTQWLTPRPESRCIPPMNLLKFEERITEFLRLNADGIVVLNGLDVLERWNGHRPVLDMIKKVHKEIGAKGNFIITLDPKSHYQTSLNALEMTSDEVVYPVFKASPIVATE